MMDNDAREAKLPQWAQAELRGLRAKVAGLQSELAQVTQSPDAKPSTASLLTLGDSMPVERPLPDHMAVVFHVKGGDIRVRVRGDGLNINGQGALRLVLNVSNDFEVVNRDA